MPYRGNRNRRNFRGRGGRGSRGNHHNNHRGGGGWHQKTPKKPEYRIQDQLNEEDVGISEFINPLEGFTAVIKARFSDFQVSEISLDGTVAKLTDTSYPKEFYGKLQEINYKGVSETPISEIPQEKWDEIKALLDKNTETSLAVKLDVAEMDKDGRRNIHECLKKHFGQKVIANTKTIDDKLCLEIKRYNKYDPSHKRDANRPWPEDKPEFVHFIVYKEMLDTMETVLRISESLRLKPSMVSYAGVKDRRAKTTQWMCVKKFEPFKLLSKTKGIRNVTIGNLEFKDKPLKLGELGGNKFRIALRNVLAENELIDKSLEFTKENGFINYYGLQRFGNDKEVPTYLIGVKLLTEQYKEAIDLILKVKASDDPELDLTKAKKIFAETRNAAEALKLTRYNSRSIESNLLEGISKHNSNDYVNALESVSRNLRLMYIHSFQSLIWNQMASKRVKEFGFKPVEGDLVLIEETTDGIDPEFLVDKEEQSENQSESEDSKADTTENETNDKPEENLGKDQTDKETKIKQKVKPLTKDDLENYTIYDIVLPLPGYDIIYPENLKGFYKEALETHQLSLEMTKHRVKSYNLSGAYRKLMGKVSGMTWKTMYFDNPTKNLIRSDLEELRGEKEPESLKDGKFKALVVEFNLKPCSYATMVLREIMKCNTSSSQQAQLNYYAETKPEDKANKRKVILEDKDAEMHQKEQNNMKDNVESSSLLADKTKYESFVNSILGGDNESKTVDETESSEKMDDDKEAVKRANEQDGDSEEPESKKSKTNEESDA